MIYFLQVYIFYQYRVITCDSNWKIFNCMGLSTQSKHKKVLFVWMSSFGPSILFLFIDFQIMVFKVKFIFSINISIMWQTASQSTKFLVSYWKNDMIKYFKIYFRYKKPARKMVKYIFYNRNFRSVRRP